MEDRCQEANRARQAAQTEVKQLDQKFKQLENNQEMVSGQTASD